MGFDRRCSVANDAVTFDLVQWVDFEAEALACFAALTRKSRSGGGLTGPRDWRFGGDLCRALIGSRTVGFFTLQDATREKGKELVVTAAAATVKGLNLVDALWPSLKTHAQQFGYQALAFHTSRPGLIRQMKKRGARVDAVVMRVSL